MNSSKITDFQNKSKCINSFCKMANILYIGTVVSIICIIVCIVMIGVGFFWIPGKPIAICSSIIACFVSIGSLIYYDKHK